MELTDKFFKEDTDPAHVLSDLYFLEGYTLTVGEAAASINVTERYLLRVFKDEFDFVMVPTGATQCFKDTVSKHYEQLKKATLADNERIALEKEIERFRQLIRKRVFINKDSFLEFLTKNLRIETNQVAIRLSQEENQKISQAELDEVVKEVIKDFKFTDTESRFVTLSEARQLLRRSILSGRTLKETYLKKFFTNNSLKKTVHDTQLHRFLNRCYSNKKFKIQGTGDERDVVRYDVFFDIPDDEIFTSFLVPNCPPRIQANIKSEVIKQIKVFREKQKEEKKSKLSE
jgi:hypothetical protein